MTWSWPFSQRESMTLSDGSEATETFSSDARMIMSRTTWSWLRPSCRRTACNLIAGGRPCVCRTISAPRNMCSDLLT